MNLLFYQPKSEEPFAIKTVFLNPRVLRRESLLGFADSLPVQNENFISKRTVVDYHREPPPPAPGGERGDPFSFREGFPDSPIGSL